MADTDQFDTLEANSEARKQDGLSAFQPTVPATTVAVKNTSGSTKLVRITGGTVTVVAVDGVTIGGMATAGLANGDWLWIRANSSVVLTYSAAPTWQWFEV